jgi:hypothetical protein
MLWGQGPHLTRNQLLHTHHNPGLVQYASNGLSNSGLGSIPRQKRGGGGAKAVKSLKNVFYVYNIIVLIIACLLKAHRRLLPE